MKGKVELYKNDGETNGQFPIKIILFKKTTRRKTISHSSIEDWNERTQLPRISHPDYDYLFPYISDIKKRTGHREFKKIEDFKEGFKFLLEEEDKIVDVCFYSYTEKRISVMYGLGRDGNAEAYHDAVNELKKFRPRLKYSEINRSLVSKFIEWKKLQGLKNTSIRNYIAEIRAIYNKCSIEYDFKDNMPFKGAFADLYVKKRRAKNVYIDYDSVKKIKTSSLPQKSFQRALDLSLLQFYLCGQYLVDVYYLKWKQIHQGRVYFERTKLGDRKELFDVKLFPEAEEIMMKYAVKGGEYVFPWSKERNRYKTFRKNHLRDTRKAIKLLNIETLPLNESFINLTPRHTFATMGKFKHIHEDIIRELMGHERHDQDTSYKDKFPQDERDDAQKRIIFDL